MMSALWRPEWVEEFTAELSVSMFRMVETQHIAATMQLVGQILPVITSALVQIEAAQLE